MVGSSTSSTKTRLVFGDDGLHSGRKSAQHEEGVDLPGHREEDDSAVIPAFLRVAFLEDRGYD